MLQTLHIENYALIRETDVSFGPGFVVITGETGAGKSILLGALGLLLGQRADTAVLADKERKCVVEAHFDLTGLGLEAFFADADIDFDGHLILRREINPAGRSRSFANDTPVQLPFLRELAAHIIDIHSQHQTLTLADSTFRLSVLDGLIPAAKAGVVDSYKSCYQDYITLKHQLEELTTADAQNRREADFLQFQYNELCEARLGSAPVGSADEEPDEQSLLEQESQLLAHAEAVREGLAAAASFLDDDSGQDVLSRLRQAKSSLSHIATYHPEAETLLARLESSLIELDDINSSLASLASSVSYNPDRQQQVDERLNLLYKLEKKHGISTLAELIAIRDDLGNRLQSMASLDERIHDLMEQVDASFARLQHAADALSAERNKVAKILGNSILPILYDLGMKEARFSVVLTDAPTYGPLGHDHVDFLFNANRGGEMRDLSKVASGGELSRLMLAIKAVSHSGTHNHSCNQTVIFDEIDTGVSGDISIAVGNIMLQMSDSMQVIAITHLPQIAARASQHLKVYKHVDDASDSTVSRIRELAPENRITEVAVMLSSDPPTAAALQTAKELMAI